MIIEYSLSERNSSGNKCLVMKQFLSADQLDEIEEIIEMKVMINKHWSQPSFFSLPSTLMRSCWLHRSWSSWKWHDWHVVIMSCDHDNQTGDFIMQVTHRKNIDRRKEKFGFDSVRFQYYYNLAIMNYDAYMAGPEIQTPFLGVTAVQVSCSQPSNFMSPSKPLGLLHLALPATAPWLNKRTIQETKHKVETDTLS